MRARFNFQKGWSVKIMEGHFDLLSESWLDKRKTITSEKSIIFLDEAHFHFQCVR